VFFHNYDHNVSSGYFLKETPGFFHNFVYNVTIMGLSHSLGVLLKSIQKCNHNVSNRILNEFFESLWWNWATLRVHCNYLEKNLLGTFWLHSWIYFEKNHSEWLIFIIVTL